MNKQLLASYVAQLNHNVVALQSILATNQFLWSQISPMLLGGSLPVASIVPIGGVGVGVKRNVKTGTKAKTSIAAVA